MGTGRQRTENQRGHCWQTPTILGTASSVFGKTPHDSGEYEAYGVGLIGLPGVTIGFNEAAADPHRFQFETHGDLPTAAQSGQPDPYRMTAGEICVQRR